MISSLRPVFANLHRQAVIQYQRRLLVLVGSSEWSLLCLDQLPQALIEKPGLWVAPLPVIPSAASVFCVNLAKATWVKPSRCHQVLGQEFSWVVVDAFDGLDPDALGASSGALCGGGLLVLLLPALHSIDKKPFDLWLEQHLQSTTAMLVIRQAMPLENLPCFDSNHPLLESGRRSATDIAPQSDTEAASRTNLNHVDSDVCLTADQAAAVKQIMRVAQGHRHRPLVISADRGRGKSASLGIAAAKLLLQRPRIIRVTAPAVSAIEPLFARVLALLPGSCRQAHQVLFEQGRVEFVALDLLLQQVDRGDAAASQCDLLLVDEAAAIPAAMLERLLRHHSRIVFSTTVHGYEGTGRGFLIRFRQALDKYTPSWRRFELTTPIRWSDEDPLERWIFDTLLLDAEPDSQPRTAVELSQTHFCHWTSEQLLAHPQQLRQLFALLVQAHYRTRPSDLRDLLDNPLLHVWLLHSTPEFNATSQLLGVVLVSVEGGFEPPLADQIWLGQRRPVGHLLPQVLAAQSGWRQAPLLHFWRVLRIAVPESLRRQGIGREMIRRLGDHAIQQGEVDILGTSFGASVDLLPFWHSLSMRPLRLGITPDASSGCVSLLYGSGCSASGQDFLALAGQRFAQDLLRQLQGVNADLDPTLVRQLLQQCRGLHPEPVDQQDQHDLYTLVFGQRGWQQVEPALYRWTLQQLAGPDVCLEPLLERVLIYRLIQRRDWAEILPLLQYTGVRQAERWLRSRLKPLFAHLPLTIGISAE